ncbi:MAG: hypothetical protein KKC19_03330 [Nanoarchaeota archaeon]|nr:hypothetical protein [Nanoarchaeota archaeon]
MDEQQLHSAVSKLSELVFDFGERRLIPARRIAEIRQALLLPPNLDEETSDSIKELALSFLEERKAYLLEELKYIGEKSNGKEKGISSVPKKDALESVVKTPKDEPKSQLPKIDVTAIKDAMLGGNKDPLFLYPDLIREEDAKRYLHELIHDKKIELAAYDLLGKGKTKEGQTVFRNHLEEFRKFYEDYDYLDILGFMKILEESSSLEVVQILSSYPRKEILDLVKIINPYDRGRKDFFGIRRDVSKEDVLPKLVEIQKALKEGHLSYYDVSKVISQERRMESNHPLFEPVIETVFKRRGDGTYDEGSVGKFCDETEGYRFKMLKRILNFHKPSIDLLAEGLKYYKGSLTKMIDILNAPSRKTEDPTEIHMFRCDEKGIIDIESLVKEFGLPYHV